MDQENLRHRRLRWAKLGAEAFKRLGLDLPEYYVCPLCLHGFSLTSAHALTREHVPPASLGGSPLVLTCWGCNSRAGGKGGVDTHASAADKLRKFSEGNPGIALRARLYIESICANVELRKSPEAFQISGLVDQNPPGVCDHVGQVLSSLAEEGKRDCTFRLLLPELRCSDAKQRASWLRAGYLASFAALGYRYIFRPVLSRVREQIRDPDHSVISFFHFVRSNLPDPRRFLILVQSPPWARGVLVNMGRHYTMLPFSDGDEEFYSRLEEGARKTSDVQITGKLIPWPSGPEHLLDFASAAFLSALIDEMKDTES